VHILGNLDFKAGVCKGELAIVTALGERTVTIQLLDPPDPANAIWVLCQVIFDFHRQHIPVTVRRHQFPLAVAFASTTNRVQGSDVTRLLANAQKPDFAHGQLIVNITRVKLRQNMRFLVPDSQILPDGRVVDFCAADRYGPGSG
jgi:hypothetical protein